jgi:steroid delta-isomerase
MKINALVEWYSNLSPERVDSLDAIYHEQARFKDPFNDVQGHQAIAAIFHHMFETTGKPSFEIIDVVQQESTAWVRWLFNCNLRGKPFSVEGISRIDFTNDGRVISHYDYWDASELLAQLPVIGTIVRYLRKKLSAPRSLQPMPRIT